MSVSAVLWVLIAGRRLKQFPADFAAMARALRLLFYIAIGTVTLPVLTSLAMGTDLPSLWALQGLFLFAVLVVCGTRYPIERFYTVNVTVIVAGVAIAAILVAAPLHAAYRNLNGYEEGRNLYANAADELTRQWHDLTSTRLDAVSGDDALAFATAFYSPDHPRYARPFEYQYTWGVPRKSTLDRGWAGLCFRDQDPCVSWMEGVAAKAGRFVRREFVARATLWGRPGITGEVVVLLVPPRADTSSDGESAAIAFGDSQRLTR